MKKKKESLKKQIDTYKEFKKYYLEIIRDLGINKSKDIEARNLLSSIIRTKQEYDLEKKLKSFKEEISSKRNIFIYGCGPSLIESVNYFIKEINLVTNENIINLAADGASTCLSEKGVPIYAVFTDLDGVTKKEVELARFLVVLGHGNNIKKLEYFHDEIVKARNLIGTTQAKPLDNLINAGGFTDGDRILYFLKTLLLPHHEIYLIGMDFQNIVGKYSKPEMMTNQMASTIKQKKLKHAIILIEKLLNCLNNNIFFVNSPRSSLEFRYLSLEDTKKRIIS
ncbi:MAG: 6-hydroxymethylpterin diphosphokinase MptE-like protein [Promethearchaeota archaeon]